LSFFIVAANRFAKIFGGITKGFSYIFHLFAPKKRFTIPVYSAPLISSKQESKIPKKIWQTNFTNQVTLPLYLNYLYNRLMSLDYEYHYVSTEDRLAFMKEHAPQNIYEAFTQLTDGAAQADLWRMFVLNFHGGVYMDIDAHAVWPLSAMIAPDDTEVFLLNKEHYTNYFIASGELTGPTTLNRAIGDKEVNHRYYRTTCIQGSFTNEHFQYIDKPRGKWTHAKSEELLKN